MPDYKKPDYKMPDYKKPDNSFITILTKKIRWCMLLHWIHRYV